MNETERFAEIINGLEAASPDEQARMLAETHALIHHNAPASDAFTHMLAVGAYDSAALMLVPTNWHLTLNGIDQSWHAQLSLPANCGPEVATGLAATPALAICLAALKAVQDR